MTWCFLDLTFDFAVVKLKCKKLILGKYIDLGV